MTAAARHLIRLDIGPIALTEDDHEFILGAFVERRHQAEDAGLTYHLDDFVRDALIAASQR